MLTTRRLRRILMHAALGAVPFIAPAVPAVTTAAIAVGSSGCCGEVVVSHDLLVPIEGAGYDALIEMCALDDLKCEALCAEALRDAGLHAPGPDDDGEDDGSNFTECVMTVHDDDFVKLETTVVTPPGGCGRRPDGAGSLAGRGPTPAAAYLAACARLEAASVHAFARLARDLTAHGAPRALVRAARRAAAEEVAHAAIVGRLAARYGAPRAALVPAAIEPRDVAPVAALARDNAVEGGVHETWGVVLARHQAAAAVDPAVRAALAPIARDETEHAALAAAVDAWARTRLSAAARRRVDRARADAIAALPAAAHAAAAALDAPGRAALGVPEPAAAAALATTLGALLAA